MSRRCQEDDRRHRLALSVEDGQDGRRLCLPLSIRNREGQDSVNFGLDAVARLATLYSLDPGPAEICSQYASYKFYVCLNYVMVRADVLLHHMRSDRHVQSQYPAILVLLQIAATLPHESVDCERDISLQNLIKTRSRNQLASAQLGALMACARDGPAFEAFDLQENLETWLRTKKRKLH